MKLGSALLVTACLSSVFLSGCFWAHRVVGSSGSQAYVIAENPLVGAALLHCVAEDEKVECRALDKLRSSELPAALATSAVQVEGSVVSTSGPSDSGASSMDAGAAPPVEEARRSKKKKTKKKKRSAATEVVLKRLKSPDGETRVLFDVTLPGDVEFVKVVARNEGGGEWQEKTLKLVEDSGKWKGIVVLEPAVGSGKTVEYYVDAVVNGERQFLGSAKRPKSVLLK